jgi:hypothetical protein
MIIKQEKRPRTQSKQPQTLILVSYSDQRQAHIVPSWFFAAQGSIFFSWRGVAHIFRDYAYMLEWILLAPYSCWSVFYWPHKGS